MTGILINAFDPKTKKTESYTMTVDCLFEKLFKHEMPRQILTQAIANLYFNCELEEYAFNFKLIPMDHVITFDVNDKKIDVEMEDKDDDSDADE